MFNLKSAALVVGLVGMLATQTVAQSVKTFDSTTSLTGSWVTGNGSMIADDLHMTSSSALTGVDVGYYCPVGETTGIVMFLYPGLEASSFHSLFLGNVEAGTGIFHFDFEQPVAAPGQNIWMGILMTNPNAGLLLANPPTVGSSQDMCWIGGPGGPMYGATTTISNSTANFALATYAAPVPEPSTLAAFATGLTGLLAFRRKRA